MSVSAGRLRRVELDRTVLSPATAALADALLERLHLEGREGTIELHFQRNEHDRLRVVKLRRHDVFTRGGLAAFDSAS